MIKKTKQSFVLCILDGWGITAEWGGNVAAVAKTPHLDALWRNFPHLRLQAAGPAVGLLVGETIGSSEVGHLTLGAGRIVLQSLSQIHMAIEDGSFFENKAFLQAIENCRKNDSKLHLLGLLSDGGVHSHIEHLFALLELCRQQKFKNVFIHILTDGRDTGPFKSLSYIEDLTEKLQELKFGKIASVCGRFFAMDRDEMWDRVQKAYQAIANGIGETADSAQQAVATAHGKGKTDEFVEPTVILENGKPLTKIEDGDSLIFWNFRPDRAREISKMFLKPNEVPEPFRSEPPQVFFVSIAEYEKGLTPNVAFYPDKIKDPLAKVLSENKLTQLHIAETTKYAHITYFLNGTIEEPFPGEDRIMVESPKVATFDKTPEMSAYQILDEVLANLKKYDFIAINFANLDMVGHTGNYEATKIATEVIDDVIGELAQAVLEKQGTMILTADHGNVEQKIDPVTGEISTKHTDNPVPFILISKNKTYELREEAPEEIQGLKLAGPGLADVAPTILDLLKLKKPESMTGLSLLK